MPVAPLSRRALGLTAAGTLAFGLAVVGAPGVAQASVPAWSASGSGPTTAVPTGICFVDWSVRGGGAGNDSSGAIGGASGNLVVELPATVGDVYTLNPGGAGGTAADASTPGAGGTSADSDSAVQGAAGTVSGGVAGGGGGAASTVLLSGSTILRAYGASGASPGGGAGGGGGTNLAVNAPDYTNLTYATVHTGAGSITGTGVPCAPAPPVLNWVNPGDRSLAVNFSDPPAGSVDGEVPAASYQYSLNGGTWTALAGVTTTDGRHDATITGLTNETPYSVALRALPVDGTGGPSHTSAAQSGTPYQPTAAATGVVATSGPQTLTVTWHAPAQTTPAVDGYEVDYSWGQAGDNLCQTDATTFTCTKTVLPGQSYDVQVYSLDSNGRRGQVATATSGTVPFSLSVPASDGALTPSGATASSLTVGKKITLTGSGYMPNSTVTVLVYSTPQVLTTVVTDSSGSFTVEVTVPDGLPAGNHTLVASGTDPGGHLRTMTLPVTVVGGTTGHGGLAYTGVEAVPLLGGGGAAVALGATLLVLARRRRTAS